MASLDLNCLPLSRRGGQEQSTLPGAHAAMPLRRPARGREADRLVIFFAMTGSAPLPLDQQKLWNDRLAQVFYQTPGSATAALRAAAETLNKYLLDRNLRGVSGGRQGVGLLTLATLRGTRLTLAVCGAACAWLLNANGNQGFFDNENAGRGLGLSKNAPLRYFQCDLNANEYLLLAAQPPEGWNDQTLAGAGALNLETLRRRLLSLAQGDFGGVLLQAVEGSGKVRWLTPRVVSNQLSVISEQLPVTSNQLSVSSELSAVSEQQPVVIEEQPTGSEQSPVISDQVPVISNQPTAVAGHPSQVGEPPPVTEPPPVRWLNEAPPVVKTPPAPKAAAQEKPPVKPKKPIKLPALPRISLGPLGRALGVIGRAFAHAGQQAGKAVTALLRRVLPDESLLTISPSAMIFFAVAIPVVLAVIGSMVYLNRGQAQQFQKYFDAAQQSASRADGLSDPAALRAAWLETIVNLDKAEAYRQGEPLAGDLRAQAVAALDQLDGIQRLVFNPAIEGGLGEERQITQMAVSSDDLYLLDAGQGLVMRAFPTGRGYEVDINFRCAPGNYSGVAVGPLVDFVPLPSGLENNPELLAIDSHGAGLFCAPGKTPEAKALALPPSGWAAPSGLAIDLENLYVLDAGTRAVWVYWGLDLSTTPALFFDRYTPTKMEDALDLAFFERRELYLLHADGQITQCTLGYLEAEITDCKDPMPFADPRPGRQSGATIPDALFSAIVYAPPPESSIFLFDPSRQAIYQFSRQLTLFYQYRPQSPLSSGGGSAFAVSSDRQVFLAVGNDVYFASLP